MGKLQGKCPFGDGSALQWIGVGKAWALVERFVPTGICPSALQQQLRAGILPAHITLPPTTFAPTSSFTQRKPQTWCRGTCHEAKERLEGTRAPPSIACSHPWVCHQLSLGDQHLKDAQSFPTCRMRSIPCPVKLLFSLKEVPT